MTPTIEHRRVNAAGLNMHVALAGWPENWTVYRRMLPGLAAHHRLILPDLRGWGSTAVTAGGYDKAQMAGDLIALLDALEIDGPLGVIGHDWGSLFAFRLALAQPERVSRLLILGGFHPWQRIDGPALAGLPRFWYQAIVAAPGLGRRAVQNPDFLRALYRRWAAPGFTLRADELRELTGELTDPARAQASSLVYRRWLTRELPALLAGAYRHQRLRTPTLILHGERDGCIAPAYVRPPQRLSDLMTVELLPGVGHFVPLEAAELCVARALEPHRRRAARA
jgi:pimeloyl-ACP methyl ester carboxylesterase